MGGSGRWLVTGLCLLACSPPEFQSVDASGGAGGIAGSGGFPSTGGNGGAAACFPWSDQIPLQQAVDENTCVEVQAGTYKLSAGVKIQPGHTLRGVGAKESILMADAANWNFDCCDAMVSDTGPKDPTVNPLRVEALTLDGAGVATYGVCCRGVTVENSVLKNARCHALGAMGTGVVARNNEMLFNGLPNNLSRGYVDCTTGGFGGIFEAAAILSKGKADRYATVIDVNRIHGNQGPALQVDGAWQGMFKDNTVYDNGGWAAVSLYAASFWQIERNDIVHAWEKPPDPYHPACVGGPLGGGSAAIFLCQDTDADGLITTDNQVIDNIKVSGYYGILSVGADEQKPSLAPRKNTFQGNVMSGSKYGCADDFKPGQYLSDDNTWTNNNCEGPANTPPGYF